MGLVLVHLDFAWLNFQKKSAQCSFSSDWPTVYMYGCVTRLFSTSVLLLQILFGYDEPTEGYDASFALDEIQFLDCQLPQWQENCDQFHCTNGVRNTNRDDQDYTALCEKR